MTSFGYHSNPRYAIKECSSCGTLYTRDCVCSIGTVEDKILVPKPPKNYALCTRCGYLFDGPNCQGCALLRQELEETLVTYSPDFHNSSKPSNASTNIVNAPREPYVVKQDNGSFVDKIIFRAPDSPDQFHCFHCKDVLRAGEACKRCTCAKCGSGLGKGLCYICGHNQNSLNDSPSISESSSQSPPNINHCCYECGDPLDGIFCKEKDWDTWDREQEHMAGWGERFGTVQVEDQITSITSLCELACQVAQKKLEEKQIEEERAAKAKYWKLPVCYDDDDDEERSDSLDDNIISGLPPFSAITPDEPVLSTEEPDNSLSMGDEHLDTIPATKSDEFLKSGVENLIPIPSESEGIPEHMCDVPFLDNSPPLDVSKDQIKDLSESNEEFSSTDDDSFSLDNINYVEASPPDSELVSSEVMEIVIPKVDAFLAVDDDHSSSQFPTSYLDPDGDMLLFEAFLNDDHSFNFKTKSSSTSLNSLLEETNNFDNSLPEFTTFSKVLFDAECESDSSNDQSSSDEDILKKIEDIRLIEKLLYDNSSPRPPEEFVSTNSDAAIKSFSSSPILFKDSDSLMEEIDLFCTLDYPMPSRILSSVPGFMKILANGFHYLKSSLSPLFNLGITNPENVRLSVLAKLQEALDEEDIQADQILTMMHRYADRFTNRRVEINNLMVLQDHALVDYGKYALGCMTRADMKKCVHLKSIRDELLRSMKEKRQLMTNYRDM
nr:hypothetical protein [Tanacetum cinerariifolium]